MLTIRYSGQFEKDAKLMGKRSHEMKKMRLVIESLVYEEELEERTKDHPMQGEYEEARDCHISTDWILIYAIVGTELRLIRTGTNSDLFE